MVGDLDGLGDLAVEVGERHGDHGALAVAGPSIGVMLEELGRAGTRPVAGDGELIRRKDADSETSRRHDRARTCRAGESETSTVGGSADTDANAVTVIPHGRSPTQQVTSTTPLASALIAWAKAAAGAAAGVGSIVCVGW